MKSRFSNRKPREHPGRSRLIIIGVGFAVTVAVAASTQWAFPPSNSWRTAVYVLIGVIVTLIVADVANFLQEKVHKVQLEIQTFLMERVNTRQKRARVIVELCQSADAEFRAVTFFPAVGIQDDPAQVPAEYLQSLEAALVRGVKVMLISVSCEEAKAYCTENTGTFSGVHTDALVWIKARLEELGSRFDNLTWETTSGNMITVNVCHNESTALMYHMGLVDDKGSGFKSTDARILEVAKGVLSRYVAHNME
jgi:hypothetical protein